MFQKRFFSSKKKGVAPLDVTNTNNVYYKICNILIKPANNMTEFTSASENVTVKPGNFNKCIKLVSPELDHTLVIIIGESTMLKNNLVMLEKGIPSEKILNTTYAVLHGYL